MSNIAVFNPSKVPTFAKGRTSALSQALGALMYAAAGAAAENAAEDGVEDAEVIDEGKN